MSLSQPNVVTIGNPGERIGDLPPVPDFMEQYNAAKKKKSSKKKGSYKKKKSKKK